ncbi:MAG TPA: hypothetical protein VK728_13685 [Candidatus Sulfotelmatobacter sp.]|jgi:hypothetical protein|nr:hypothetical protein [Candidatus Sulfotelmatobacter sp.]
MLTKILIAVFFTFAFTGAPALNAQSQTSAPTPQDAALKPAPSDNPAADATPPRPHKKVYTNDNLPKANPGDFSGADFSEINNCDRNCFEQVRQLAHVFPGSNPNWKRDLLRALDTVRKDADWQKYLGDLYAVHQRFCALGAEKRDELAHVADPANVTPREITVEEKYDAKFKQAQSSLEQVSARQHGLQQIFGASPFSLQFSQLQVSRIQNAPCGSQRYPDPAPSEGSDP